MGQTFPFSGGGENKGEEHRTEKEEGFLLANIRGGKERGGSGKKGKGVSRDLPYRNFDKYISLARKKCK